MSDNLYTQTVKLPSKGLLNPEITDGLITQRCMMVTDEKYLAGTKAEGDVIVRTLIERTATVPEKLDCNKLILADLMFLLFKMRILSYGDDYAFMTRCPACHEKIDVHMKLSELAVHELPDDYEDSLVVKLPHKGDTVYTRFLTIGDQEEIKRESKRLKKKFKDMEGSPDIVLRLAAMITKIELQKPNNAGDKVLTDPIDIRKYVEELTSRDSNAIKNTIGNVKVGVDPAIDYVCPECEEDIELDVSFSADFFRG